MSSTGVYTSVVGAMVARADGGCASLKLRNDDDCHYSIYPDDIFHIHMAHMMALISRLTHSRASLVPAVHSHGPRRPHYTCDQPWRPLQSTAIMPAKSQAEQTLDKALKKFSSSTGWFSSSSTKFEEAGDLFQQAANAFKVEHRFEDAGNAFAKEAECRENCQENNDAANAWWNAAKAYKHAMKPDRKHCTVRIADRSLSLCASRCPSTLADDHPSDQVGAL